MNYAVDGEKKEAAQVVQAFLKQRKMFGLLEA
jgi:hypothetical protein